MTQDRINQIRERLRNVKEFGISGYYTANGVKEYYLEDVYELLKEIERLKDNDIWLLYRKW